MHKFNETHTGFTNVVVDEIVIHEEVHKIILTTDLPPVLSQPGF